MQTTALPVIDVADVLLVLLGGVGIILGAAALAHLGTYVRFALLELGRSRR
jgi:hypothetical protein